MERRAAVIACAVWRRHGIKEKEPSVPHDGLPLRRRGTDKWPTSVDADLLPVGHSLVASERK